ncbi:MAG: HypC/HybG/HupF family hydrogenase formation chaperone [Acidimicrobiales bacterium]
MATVDFGGVTKNVCLAYTPEARLGEYVIIHAGFAIAVLDEAAAMASLDLFEEIGLVEPVDGGVDA